MKQSPECVSMKKKERRHYNDVTEDGTYIKTE